MNTLFRRTSAFAAAALAAGALTLPAGTAHAATPDAVAAGSWLSGVINPSDGLLPGAAVTAQYGGYTTNLDYGISLAQSGQVPSAAFTKINAGIGNTIATFLGDIQDPANAGKVAKAALYYQLTGQNAANAGASHLDLAGALAGDVDDVTGQLGDTANVYNQVWGVRALTALHSAEADAARNFLLSERGYAATDAWGYDGDGDAATKNDWSNDADATSWAISALAPWRGEPEVDAAISAGVAYLKSMQENGGIDLGWGSGANANSTGLAAVALHDAGESAAAASAASWVKAHQLTSGPAAGAIAYDDGALKAATSAGIEKTVLSQWVAATAQALPALRYLPAPVAHPVAKAAVKQLKSAKGVVRLKVTRGGKPFTGKVVVKVGKKKLVTKSRKGIVTLKAAKILGHKKKVRATVILAGGRATVLIKKR